MMLCITGNVEGFVTKLRIRQKLPIMANEREKEVKRRRRKLK